MTNQFTATVPKKADFPPPSWPPSSHRLRIVPVPTVDLHIAGQRLRRSGTRIVVGRGLDCNVIVKAIEASRHHMLLVHVAGRWLVHDLDSTNGTWRRGRRIKAVDVHAGDIFSLGKKGPRVRIVALDPAPRESYLSLDVEEGSLERELTGSTGR